MDVVDALPEDLAILVDEAYYDFVDRPDAGRIMSLARAATAAREALGQAAGTALAHPLRSGLGALAMAVGVGTVAIVSRRSRKSTWIMGTPRWVSHSGQACTQ